MALQSPFFNNNTNKRDLHNDNSALRGAHAAAATVVTPVPATAAAPAASKPAAGDSESKLTVGPNIKLKGVEITDCDTLLVEGSVEATMDSRVIEISERGSFRGSAEIDIAEIRGQFDGSLTVREKLTIYSTGKVTGRIRYGKIVIEEGGQLSGEIEFGAQRAAGTGANSNTRPLQQVNG